MYRRNYTPVRKAMRKRSGSGWGLPVDEIIELLCVANPDQYIIVNSADETYYEGPAGEARYEFDEADAFRATALFVDREGDFYINV